MNVKRNVKRRVKQCKEERHERKKKSSTSVGARLLQQRLERLEIKVDSFTQAKTPTKDF